MKLLSEQIKEGALIPEPYAWGRMAEDGTTLRGENRTPHLRWESVPEGTKSFLLACLDDDVPTDRAERDARGEIPAFQPRCRFVHWVQADLPSNVRAIAEGALTETKKLTPGFGRAGINDYSRGETPVPGQTGTGYDGPCPPFFDARWHFYRFMVVALDVSTLGLPEAFRWEDAQMAMKGHVLATAELVGRYSLNPRLRNEKY